MTDPKPPNKPTGATRPHHLHPGLILVVALGGVLGTAGRYGLATLLPAQHGLPVGTAVENVFGAFALGALLELLARTTQESPGRRVLRLGLGTGVLGGFTSYSALALETWHLLGDQPVLALVYSLGSLLLGLMACFTGVALSATVARRRAALLPRDPDADELQAQARPAQGRPAQSRPKGRN